MTENADAEQPFKTLRIGSLEGIIEHISAHGTTRFDDALATHLNGIASCHSQTVGDCTAGHHYGSEWEICAEYHDAHELAAAWLQSKLEGGL